MLHRSHVVLHTYLSLAHRAAAAQGVDGGLGARRPRRQAAGDARGVRRQLRRRVGRRLYLLAAAPLLVTFLRFETTPGLASRLAYMLKDSPGGVPDGVSSARRCQISHRPPAD